MNIKDYITKSKTVNWEPLIENGIHYKGIAVKSLYFDKATNRSKAILLKFNKGASYPYHIHPEGDELFVLAGSCEIDHQTLAEGDYLYTRQKANIVLFQKQGVPYFYPFQKKSS